MLKMNIFSLAIKPYTFIKSLYQKWYVANLALNRLGEKTVMSHTLYLKIKGTHGYLHMHALLLESVSCASSLEKLTTQSPRFIYSHSLYLENMKAILQN